MLEKEVARRLRRLHLVTEAAQTVRLVGVDQCLDVGEAAGPIFRLALLAPAHELADAAARVEEPSKGIPLEAEADVRCIDRREDTRTT